MYGDREWGIGDTVYKGDARAHKIETLVRTTHDGKRFVTDEGTSILKSGKYEVGSHFRIMWHLYTPDVEDQWGKEIARRTALQRLFNLEIEARRDPWRYMDTATMVEIADFIEQRLPRKETQDERT